MHFFEWKYIDFDWNVNEVYSQGPNEQYSSIGSDNGLASTKRQAIMWTNDEYFADSYIRHLVLNGLRSKPGIIPSTSRHLDKLPPYVQKFPAISQMVWFFLVISSLNLGWKYPLSTKLSSSKRQMSTEASTRIGPANTTIRAEYWMRWKFDEWMEIKISERKLKRNFILYLWHETRGVPSCSRKRTCKHIKRNKFHSLHWPLGESKKI